jgi:tRNA-splicing ligase RtcB
VEGTKEFGDYMKDLHWAQNYALQNREAMMDAVLKDLMHAIRWNAPIDEVRRINCHHNYTAKEHHYGKDIWVTRKGAIRARVGDYGVIPGSMGTNSYIVKGLGNKSSFDSSAHGAGRKMSRTQARKELTVDDLEQRMEGKTWNSKMGKKLLDEHPDSYKDIEVVMRDQADLVEIETELHQILNYKGA